MFRDCIEIGAAPNEEDCAQVGGPDYARRARAECERYIKAIRAKLGPEPEGAELRIKLNAHDFGNYLEVVCDFDADNLESRAYALAAEEHAPSTWSDTTPFDWRKVQTEAA